MPPKGYKLSEESKRRISIAKTKPKIKCICDYCGTEFDRQPSDVKKKMIRGSTKNYCCKEHASLDRVGISIPKEVCEKRGKKLKGRVFTEEHIKNLSDAAKIVMNTPERKAKQAELASKRFKGKRGTWAGKKIPQNVIEARIAPLRGKPKSKEHCDNISKGNKGKPKSEKQIIRSVESKIGGFWYGNVRYNGVQYCELWKDVNPRVHAFFENKCVECGEPMNGKSHAGHHIFYVKRACCWHSEGGIYYTNLNAPGHPAKDYCIGENPNYFVILCNKCHSKTNGNYENRKKWADHFKRLIDTKYGGKCYLTKDEYAAYMLNNS